MSSTDKAKETAKGLFSKTKTEFARTKQKVLEKVGKAEETIDISFNQEKERFLSHYKAIKLLRKNITKYLEVARELSEAQTKIADDFYQLYDTTVPAMYNVALKNQDTTKLIDNARTQFEQQIRQDFLDPLTKYISQFKEIKTRIAELEVRRVDMDRYGRDVKVHTEKGKTKTTSEVKYEAAKSNYNNLNDELLRDMPLLYADRYKFFEPAFATYLTALAEFNRQSSKFTTDAASLVASTNRAAIHDHKRVITSIEQTSMKHKLTAADETRRSTITSIGSVSPPVDTNPVRRSTLGSSPYAPSAPPAQTPPPRPTPNTPPSSLRARAMFDFVAQDSSELSFKVGDTLTILKNNGDWWEGELNGRIGLLPSNYVKLV